MYQPAALQVIVGFVTGCLNEDEKLAQLAGSGNWRLEGGPGCYTECRIDGDDMIVYDEGGHTREQAEHIVRHGPEDVLDDIAAKRALVALHGDYYEDPCLKLEDGGAWDPELYEPCLTLRWVASGYKRREGFKESWRLG